CNRCERVGGAASTACIALDGHGSYQSWDTTLAAASSCSRWKKQWSMRARIVPCCMVAMDELHSN
ncbi:hypothetical protein Dimus_030540, partial [Dionaea muscipula]